MNSKTILRMIAGIIPTPDHMKPTIEQLRPLFPVNYFRNLFSDNQDVAPSLGQWEARHESGRRCGHIHRDHGKACACAARLGSGWTVVQVG